MNEEGQATVEDLSTHERVKALLPATSALLAILAIAGLLIVWYTQQQRDQDRRAFEKKIQSQAATLAATQKKLADTQAELQATQRTARKAQLRAEQTRKLSDARYAYSFNKLACNLRSVADQQITRLEKAKPPGYREGLVFWRKLKASNVPIPEPDICLHLPKKPPPNTAPPVG